MILKLPNSKFLTIETFVELLQLWASKDLVLGGGEGEMDNVSFNIFA